MSGCGKHLFGKCYWLSTSKRVGPVASQDPRHAIPSPSTAPRICSTCCLWSHLILHQHAGGLAMLRSQNCHSPAHSYSRIIGHSVMDIFAVHHQHPSRVCSPARPPARKRTHTPAPARDTSSVSFDNAACVLLLDYIGTGTRTTSHARVFFGG